MIEENIIFKVTGEGTYEEFNYTPTYIRKKYISKKIEETKLFKYLGPSRIDGLDMYGLKPLLLRRMKIDKILKKDGVGEDLENIMFQIRNDIDMIRPVEDYFKNNII